MRVTEQVGNKRSTDGTHRNAECLLKNTPSKHILRLINHDDYETKHLMNVSFNSVCAIHLIVCRSLYY